MSDQGPPALTDSDHSENSTESEMEEGTSDYGSKTGNDDSDRSDSDESSQAQDPPPPRAQAPPAAATATESIGAEELKAEGNNKFNEGDYIGAISKYKEAVIAAGGNNDSKVKCFSNISHCLNRRKKFSEAVDYALKAIDTKPEFHRGYVRCAEALNGLGEPKMAAVALMKGETWGQHPDLQTELKKIEKGIRDEARKYISKYHNNLPQGINLRKLREKGFKKDEDGGKVNEPPKKAVPAGEIPGLVVSSDPDTGSSTASSCSEGTLEGGGPAAAAKKSVGSPKKKKNAHRSKPSKKSGDDSSDDENGQKNKRLKKKTAELIKKEQDEQLRKQDEKLRKQVEEVKRNEEAKVAAEKRKEELDKKKKADEYIKRKDEERKKIIAINDPKEVACLQFNDILVEASDCFRRNLPNRSLEKYAEALDFVGKNFKDLKFKSKNMKQCDEVVVIKFMFARACINTHSYPDILTGHAKLNDILMVHAVVRFPAVYLGFALLFKKLNRYEQALVYVEKGVEFINKNIPFTGYNYPGLSFIIEETEPEFLKKSFQSLMREFKCPPKPQAVCKYKDCLIVNKDNHIIPSENIYLTDPDFKGYFKVWCRENCSLDFHENCWVEKKNDYIEVLAKSSKTPTEKDFFGLACFTPDCNGIIIKIQIFDSYGDVKTTLEDKKLMERIESEERMKKEEEKKRKEKEAKDSQQRKLEERIKKNKKRKERNKSSSEKESDGAKEIKVDPPKVVIASNNPAIDNYNKISTPPPDISLGNITILKKKPEVEEEVTEKKKTKKKERNTLHLDEFNNSELPPTESGIPDLSDYRSRIERLAAVKKTYEASVSAWQTRPDLYVDNYLNPNASVFNPNPAEKISPAIIEESVKSFVLQTLKTDGPLKETDSRFSKEFGPEAKAFILERRGMINLLRSDERFGSYDDIICLKGDAEKAKKMKDLENKADNTLEKKPVNLGDMARKIREQLEDTKKSGSFGLLEASKEASILDSIKKDADAGAKGPIVESIVRGNAQYQDLGVQTDVSSLDLDELDDPIILKQSNGALLAELQESKDKLYQVQNQRKVETKEMMDQVKVLKDEKSKAISDNNNLNETIQKMNKTYREAARKEEELKKTKDNLESEQVKTGGLRSDLNNTKLKLENEQRLSFQLQSQLQSQRDQEMTMVKSLKLRFLKNEYDWKKSFLMNKNLENGRLISYLNNMNSNESNQPNFSVLKSSIDKLNEFSAKLFNGLENLQAKYEGMVRQVELSPGSLANSELHFDTSSLESPQLTSVEVDTLRLLTSSSLNTTITRPPGAPFPGLPLTSRPPPTRPPGLLGPPPGLAAKVETSSAQADQLASIRATITRPRPGSSPRPAPGAVARPPPAVPVQAGAGVGGVGPIAPPSGPRNKSYQKLLAQLQGRYPDLSPADAEKYIGLLRDSNNGKLSGMSIQSIFDRVGTFMRTDRERRRVENDTDNNCSICLEDMTERDSRKLNPCDHRFHTKCINEWLSTPGGAGNTCPMCRHYIIQEEEFPDLGHRGHRRH